MATRRNLGALAMGLVVFAGACSEAPEALPTAVATVSEPAASPSTVGPSSPYPTSDPTGPAPSPTSSPTPPPASVRFGPDTMPALHPSVDDYPTARVRIEPATGPAWDIPVLLATTNETRAHGLMEVPDVPDATGMAFLFPEDRDGGFWMKGTETDLDIAWFDTNGVVVALTTMEVCEADPCPSYRPGATYRYALEVTAGWFGQIGLVEGDRILFSEAGNPPIE